MTSYLRSRRCVERVCEPSFVLRTLLNEFQAALLQPRQHTSVKDHIWSKIEFCISVIVKKKKKKR